MLRRTMLLALSLCFLFVSFASAAPRMTLSESVFNFGYAPQNSKVSYVFWLHSTGDDSLKIINVVPGCGCTQAPLEKKDVAVGDSTKLEIIFSTKMYKHHITKRPKIETNEGPPDKRIQIITDVVARPDSTYPLILKPYKLDLSQFGEKLRDRIDFKIENVSDQTIDLSMIYTPNEYFIVELPSSIGAGTTADASLILKKEVYDQNFEKSFTIETNDKDHSRFTIPVKRQVRQSESLSTAGH